jgi:hypothetical protein
MSDDIQAAAGQMPRQLRAYWTHGKGAAEIAWGTPNDFDRCVSHLNDYVTDAKGLCNELHHDALGYYPATHAKMERAAHTAAVNSRSWQSMPIAARETTFRAQDAVARGLEWAGSSASKFNSLFLWRKSDGNAGSPDSYRLPIADIINGKPVMIPRAVFSAGVILSGGHGELEGVVDDQEKLELKRVVSEIYDKLRDEYQDPRVVAPWERGGNDREDVTAAMDDFKKDWEVLFGDQVWTPEGLVASVNSSGWTSMPIADVSRPWDSGAAKARVWSWADGDFRKYRRAFLWYDPEHAEQKNGFKLPIADVIDGELTIIPRAVNAVAAVLGGARGGVDIPDSDMSAVENLVNRIQKRFPDGEDSQTASAAPVKPPRSAFEYNHSAVTGPQPFTVSADGQTASGHLWLWNKCHAGIGNECVVAPRTATDYAYFHNGQVLTADGALVKVGKITMGTGHAAPGLRWIPAADHYDNTGVQAAVGRVTEDRWGGYFNGVPVSTMTEEQIAELRRSPISGDWRRINGNLELVAALAVNTPGYPIVASLAGEVLSITAAGVLLADGTVANEYTDGADNEAESRYAAIIDEVDSQMSELLAKGRARMVRKMIGVIPERRK